MLTHLIIALSALSAAPGDRGGGLERPVEAVTQARHDLDLGFTIRGSVRDVPVRPGQRVEEGQILIELDDREGAAQVRLYSIRAEGTLEIQAADAEWKMAQNDEARLKEAYDKGGAAEFELERARLETLKRRLALDLHAQRREETLAQLELAKAQHERSTLKAPMAGVVEEVIVGKGEMVDETRPVLRLVVIDPLVIDAPAPMERAMALNPGAAAWARFKVGGAVVEGRITHVASVADPGSETRTVRIEIPNRHNMPAGSHVEIFFERPSHAAP